MRRSEWRRRADDPKGPLGWWWRGVWENGWPAYALPSVGVCFAMTYGLPSVAIVATGLLILAQAVRAVRAPDRLRALLPDPAPEGQFRAAVEYRRDGLVTGRDDMALTVVDGWLVGEGLRSEFALRAEDVSRLGAGELQWARLVLSDLGEIYLSGLDEASCDTLQRWRYPFRLMPGEPTFPPARVHEQEVARWFAWVVVGGMAWPTLNLLGALVSRGAEGRLAWMLAGLALGGLVAGFGVVQAKRLSRIDAEARKALDLSPRPFLRDEPFGEGESVRVR